ncbi:MAG: diacylglycerol kinase family protein, partial [Roseicyclus sp.]
MTIYHNPSAGTGAISRADLMAAFRGEGFRPDYVERGKEGDGCPSEDPIVIAGGDGTVKRALDLFGGAGRRFAILPLGGANNIARSLGL